MAVSIMVYTACDSVAHWRNKIGKGVVRGRHGRLVKVYFSGSWTVSATCILVSLRGKLPWPFSALLNDAMLYACLFELMMCGRVPIEPKP